MGDCPAAVLPREGRVEASEIAETIRGEEEERIIRADASFRRLTGIYLGIVATKVMLNANIQASDTYGYYQSKYIRQTSYRLAADQLEAQLAAQPAMPEPAKAQIEDTIKRWRAAADRYESDPASGQGKKELLAAAKKWEASRDRAARRDPNFDFAEALFQIAIVLGSVSIVAASRPLVKLSGGLAVLATLLMLNGYFLLVQLPVE
jgi:hypothetical protein